MDDLEIIFDKPAAEWNEALPLGNGTMGAMSYGRFQNEKIELNLDTLWSGNGRYKENMNAHADLEFLRKRYLPENTRMQRIIAEKIFLVIGQKAICRQEI